MFQIRVRDAEPRQDHALAVLFGKRTLLPCGQYIEHDFGRTTEAHLVTHKNQWTIDGQPTGIITD